MWRRDFFGRSGEVGNDGPRTGKLGVVAATVRQVLDHGSALIGRQGVDGERRQELVHFLAGETHVAPASCRRRWPRASRSRLFTVPTGTFIRAAASTVVRPLK